jgi:DNA polymerase I-like protein with 3'-5' exonuclease and polymerase domains
MNIITTAEQLAEFVAAYSKVEAFAWDTETIGDNRLYPVINDVCWISFATDGRTDVIPMGHPNGSFEGWDKPLLLEGQRRIEAGKPILESHYSKDERKWTAKFGPAPKQLTPGEVFKAIEPLLFGPALKIAHNAKFDLKSVAKYYGGRVPTKPNFDTMMAAFIINNANKFELGLAACVKRELGIEVEKGVGENVALHSFEDVAKYSGIDADVTWKLYKALSPKITGNLTEFDILDGALADKKNALFAKTSTSSAPTTSKPTPTLSNPSNLSNSLSNSVSYPRSFCENESRARTISCCRCFDFNGSFLISSNISWPQPIFLNSNS